MFGHAVKSSDEVLLALQADNRKDERRVTAYALGAFAAGRLLKINRSIRVIIDAHSQSRAFKKPRLHARGRPPTAPPWISAI